MNAPDTHLLIGELKSAYGIKGWLWVYAYTDPRENIFEYTPWVYRLGAAYRALEIDNWRVQGSGLVVKLQGVDDRTAAERYTGTKIWLDKANLPKPQEGEVYVSDLIGLTVRLSTGEVIGRVAEFIDNAAHPIVKVIPSKDGVDNQTRLIPWHDSTIVKVDVEAGVVELDWFLDY